MHDHQLVFICGLHRSGTWFLTKCLEEHHQISSLNEEGQFLQDVYPIDKAFGGTGVMGFSPDAHLTELSDLATMQNAQRLFEQWSPYWDLSKNILVEKTPTNLLRTRFLQNLFPGSRFIVVQRHPVAVSLATQKWSRTGLFSLMTHWFHCYDLFSDDSKFLKHVHIVRYEDMMVDLPETLRRIADFLDIEPWETGFTSQKYHNQRYFQQWSMLLDKSERAEFGRFQSFMYRFIRRLSLENKQPVLTASITDAASEVRAAATFYQERAAHYGYNLWNPDEPL